MAEANDNQIVKQEENIPSFVENLSELVVNKPNCKLCQFEQREEVEKVYERTSSLKAAYNAATSSGFEGSYIALRNHLLYHFEKPQKDAQIKEYAQNLSKYIENKRDKRKKLLERIAMLEKQMYELATEAEVSKIMDNKFKAASEIKKLSDSVTTMEEKLTEIEKEFHPVEIVIERLKEVITIKIQSTNNDEIKSALMDVLEDMSKKVGDIEI
jgi:adenine-specific DNA glycosylase